MYREQRRVGGAYTLLHASGASGSRGPADGADVDAPLVHASRVLAAVDGGGGNDSDAQLPEGAVVALVPAAACNAFLERLAADAALQARVAAALVDDGEAPAAYSSLPKFPQAEFAPYYNSNASGGGGGGYVWNPAGSDVGALAWPVPVVRLEPALAGDARARADYNAQRGHRGRLFRARVRLPMSTPPDAANAAACLAADTCRPLGGFSVWAALPPLAAGANATKLTTLVLAQADGYDIFHDAIQGANAPLSGLVAMLTALTALGDDLASGGGGHAGGAGGGWLGGGGAAPAAALGRQFVFVALAGEPWGYMGSKAFLWELERGGVAVQGLDLALVDQVVEVGAVGRSLRGGGDWDGGGGATARLFAHAQRGAAFGDAAPVVAALRAAAAALPPELGASVAPASAATPGVPPASLMSFLRAKPQIAGAVLTEFDQAVTDPYYGGRFDAAGRADARAIARAAGVVAGALRRLAAGGGNEAAATAPPPLNATRLLEVAEALTDCLIAPDPGFSCPTAEALMTPGYTEEAGGARSYAARHYVGVLQVVSPEPQSPAFKGDVARFLWNYMALASVGAAPVGGGGGGGGSGKDSGSGSGGSRGAACDPGKNPCPAGQVCAGWRAGEVGSGKGDAALLGACVNATARYVPALSTRITCEACDDVYGAFRWVETNASDAWAARLGWPRDAMWAESDWPATAPFVQLYLRKPYSARAGILAAGVALTVAAAAGSLVARRAFERHLKSS